MSNNLKSIDETDYISFAFLHIVSASSTPNFTLNNILTVVQFADLCSTSIHISGQLIYIKIVRASGPGDQQEVTVNQNTAKMTNEDQPRHPTTDCASFVIFNEAHLITA